MIDGVGHHIANVMRPPRTHYGLVLFKPPMRWSTKVARSTLSVCLPNVFVQHKLLLYDLVLRKLLSRSVHIFAKKLKSQTLLFPNLQPTSSPCLRSTGTFRTKYVCFHTAHALSENSNHHLLCDKASHMPSPTALFMSTINTGSLRPPPSFQGNSDSVAN